MFLRLPVTKDGDLQPLGGHALLQSQRKIEGIQYIVISEECMISLGILSYVDQRLRQLFPER